MFGLPQMPTDPHHAGCWYLHSGIQDATGGVARFYRADLQKNARVSTEITGYALSALLWLHSQTGEESYRDAARRAAEFLIGQAWDEGLGIFPFEHSSEGDAEPLAYFFDNGIVVRGLLCLWRDTGADRLLDVARRAAQSMARDFRGPDGFHPVLALPSKQPLPHEERWSRRPGCFQLKAALAWRELFEITGEHDFLEWYEALRTWSIETHAGFLAAEPDRERVMDRLHAYAYFLEGLLPEAANPACAAALDAGIGTLSRCLRDIAPVFARSDVYAQLLRVRLFAHHAGVLPLRVTEAEEEARSIAAFQPEHADRRARGGFWFGRKGSTLLPYVNPVSTAFCLQALDLWRQHQSGEWPATWRELI